MVCLPLSETKPTMNTTTEISPATESDLDGILELQAANQIANGGSLSVSFSRSRLVSMINVLPQLVARRDARVIGFLLSSTCDMGIDIPIIRAMLNAYPARAQDAYVYGPICVDARARGKGLAQAMFAELRRLLPGREGVLFIRSDNESSLKSHRKMGMQVVSHFSFAGVDHEILSYIG